MAHLYKECNWLKNPEFRSLMPETFSIGGGGIGKISLSRRSPD
jgi:hypothetical protein